MAPIPEDLLEEAPSVRLAWLAIHEGGCRTQGEVQRWAGISGGGTTETLRDLEEAGRVVCIDNITGDLRRKYYYPPAEAEEILEERRPDTHTDLEVES